MPEEDCIAELRESKLWLEDVVGERIGYLSAPQGACNRRILRLAHQEGYVLTGTSVEWMNSFAEMTVPGKVDRVAVRGHFSRVAFRHIIEGHLPFYLWRQVRSAALIIPKRILGK